MRRSDAAVGRAMSLTAYFRADDATPAKAGRQAGQARESEQQGLNTRKDKRDITYVIK